MSRQIKSWISLQLQRMKMDPIGAAEESAKLFWASEHSAHMNRYATLVVYMEFASRLKSDPQLLNDFLDRPFWLGGYKPDRENVALLVSRFLRGAKRTTSSLYELARTDAEIISYYLEHRHTAQEVFDELCTHKMSGIRALIQKEKKFRFHNSSDLNDPSESFSADVEADIEFPSSKITGPRCANHNKIAEHESNDETSQGDDLNRTIQHSTDDRNQKRKSKLGKGSGRRMWERDLITHARLAWDDGYDVVLVPMSSGRFETLMCSHRAGKIKLTCSYEPGGNWRELYCFDLEKLI